MVTAEEPFVELAQWKILGVQGTAQRHAIAKTGTDISELEVDVIVQRRYRYYIWKVFLPLLAMVAIAYSAFGLVPATTTPRFRSL